MYIDSYSSLLCMTILERIKVLLNLTVLLYESNSNDCHRHIGFIGISSFNLSSR